MDCLFCTAEAAPGDELCEGCRDRHERSNSFATGRNWLTRQPTWQEEDGMAALTEKHRDGYRQ